MEPSNRNALTSHGAALILGLLLGSQIPSAIWHYQLSRDFALFEQQLRDEPASADNWVSLGVTKARADDDEGALKAYEKAMELDPASVNAHVSIGNTHYQRNDFEEAEEWYTKALKAAHAQNDVSGIATADQLLKFARAAKTRSGRP